MIEDDIQALIRHSKGILDYHASYGHFFWPQTKGWHLSDVPTKRVVTQNDYVSTLVDIENALCYLEEISLNQSKQINQLSKFAAEIKKIICHGVSKQEIVEGLAEDLDYLESELAKINGDIFFYETACRFRELIEKKKYVLRNCTSAVTPLENFQRRLDTADTALKAERAKIVNLNANLKKPFPDRPCYTPESYWWYIS